MFHVNSQHKMHHMLLVWLTDLVFRFRCPSSIKQQKPSTHCLFHVFSCFVLAWFPVATLISSNFYWPWHWSLWNIFRWSSSFSQSFALIDSSATCTYVWTTWLTWKTILKILVLMRLFISSNWRCNTYAPQSSMSSFASCSTWCASNVRFTSNGRTTS